MAGSRSYVKPAIFLNSFSMLTTRVLLFCPAIIAPNPNKVRLSRIKKKNAVIDLMLNQVEKPRRHLGID